MPTKPSLASSLELWAGVECSVTRVRDEFYDQLERQGHWRRATDLDLFAGLGVRALRYPVLWEKTAPHSLDDADWSWAEQRLSRLRELNVRPIVGLLHHGSGPRYTSLIDEGFPEKLAHYARAVASKFPWVEDYTPVNEPLTTARFSGLYGHWYPHGSDDQTFMRALLNECRGVVLAMRAIRSVNPRARLIQTEDLGKTYSTRRLAYQAEFENERRWLSFDLLAGRIRREHPLWIYLLSAGASQGELEWFCENATPPDVLGINHYLTSERFLDERLARYPLSTHGGNGRQEYADVEAVRVLAEGIAGPRSLMKEAWERYGLPIAVTEAHLGCTREEQLRWLKEIWDGALSLRAEGADVRAVTAWSLLGSFDWNSLLTRADNVYEPGVFDLRCGERPRRTALANMLDDLANGLEHNHAVLDAPGWWRRLDRLEYTPFRQRPHEVSMTRERVNLKGERARPLLITGATGTLGRAFARMCEARGLSYHLLTRREMDIACEASVEKAITEYEPWAIVNTAGYVRVDDAEREAWKCLRENSTGARVLAEACARFNLQLVTFSSDLVFDGRKACAYVESDEARPLNVYGRSKLEAEREALGHNPRSLVIRTSAFFGPWDEYNFLTVALRALGGGRRFAAAHDAIVSPTYVPDLVNASLDLLIDGEAGIWHLTNAGEVSWADFARGAASEAGFDGSLIDSCSIQSFNFPAQRPFFSALTSERGLLLPSVEDAVKRYVRDCEVSWKTAARIEPERLSTKVAVSAGKK
jgi:dTDP-4-dehydrorhamnose reductase